MGEIRPATDTSKRTGQPSGDQQPVRILVYLIMWIAHALVMAVLLIPFDLTLGKTIAAAFIMGWFSMIINDRR